MACVLAAGGMTHSKAAEAVLHNFINLPPRGATPSAGDLVRDSAGNLYGTTYSGGSSNSGVVYLLNSSGAQTVLHEFTGGVGGGNPYAGVTIGTAGTVYGTTYNGGAANCGVVYELSSSGQFTVLYSFPGGSGGCHPYAGAVLDAQGDVYAVTVYGGNPNGCYGMGCGVLYKITPTGQATILHAFTGGTDGSQPFGTPTLDSKGNLYGTTEYGGNLSNCYGSGCGVVYELGTSGRLRILYSFTGGADGSWPLGGVIVDKTGDIYGTTTFGGPNFAGAVFKVDAAGAEKTLYTFTGGTDGANPRPGVTADGAGNVYGTTENGGASGAGVVFQVTNSGETVLHNFTGGPDGGYPYAGVVLDASGNLYGTTTYGGTSQVSGTGFTGYSGYGAVYKLEISTQQETQLYAFPGGGDGVVPYAGLTADGDGNLYGTTEEGGAANTGTVYKVDPAGQETVLYSFTGGADGGYPYGGVILDSDGNLYGTTYLGGTAGFGVVYKVDALGRETVLHNFVGDSVDGSSPMAGVIRDSKGNLYGTTTHGGAGYGVIYKLDANGNFTMLYSFNGLNGNEPYSGVIADTEGNLYGTTYYGGWPDDNGVVYKLDASHNLTVLYSFSGGADGGEPYAGVIRDVAGNLYGTASLGGTNYNGVVYRLNPSGQQSVLYSFTGGADGGYPYASVVEDPLGNLYGTTYDGGAAGYGVVYQVNASGEKVLYSFTGGADGGYPYAGVIRDSSGNLLGTTGFGGKENTGTVFTVNAQ
jgi:uncharacterized repeat protein (TIGR03803 family)